jgi:hypothetical protein
VLVHGAQFNGKQEGDGNQDAKPELRCPRNGRVFSPSHSHWMVFAFAAKSLWEGDGSVTKL